MHDPMLFSPFTLPSGLKVFHQYRDLPWFIAQVQVGIGHRDDPVGKEGLAHLLEHQLSSGTEGLPQMPFTEFREWMEDRQFDFDYGSTSMDFTEYGGLADVSKAEPFFRFFEAFLRRPRLDGTMIEHDRAIIRAERIDRTGPRKTRHGFAVAKALYGDSPLATRTGLPEDDVLNGLTQEDVREAHRRFYDCPNMTLVVAGGITSEKLSSMLTGIFTAAPPTFAPRPAPEPVPLRVPEPREILTPLPQGRKASSVQLVCIWPQPPSRSRTCVLVRHCLTRILNDRIREKERLAYGVHVHTNVFLDRANLWVTTDVDPANVGRIRTVIEETVRDRDAVLAPFDKVQRQIAGTISRIDRTIGATVGSALNDISQDGRPIPLQEIVEQFESLKREDASAYLAGLDPDRALVHMFET